MAFVATTAGTFAQTPKPGVNSVDLAAPPKPYKGWEVETQLPGVGLLEWPKGYLVPAQLFVPPGSKLIHGPEFLDALKGKEPYNRNLMDYLLIHQEENSASLERSHRRPAIGGHILPWNHLRQERKAVGPRDV